jgi:hypothetical protein
VERYCLLLLEVVGAKLDATTTMKKKKKTIPAKPTVFSSSLKQVKGRKNNNKPIFPTVVVLSR